MLTGYAHVCDSRGGLCAPPVPRGTTDGSRMHVTAGLTILAGLAAVALTVQALAAPAVLLAAGALIAVGRLSRWRVPWLLVPFALSTWWLRAEGLRRAVAALASGGARLVSAECAVAMRPDRLLHPGTLGAGPGRWLPPQLPLALAAGTAEAAVVLLAWWHRRGRPPWRPGILAVARRQVAAAGLRAGRSVTADGCAVGVTATGRRAELTWKAAESGVVVTGPDDRELAGPAAASALRSDPPAQDGRRDRPPCHRAAVRPWPVRLRRWAPGSVCP